MKKKLLRFFTVSLLSFAVFIVGCSSNNNGVLDPNANISQEIPNDPEIVENQPPLVKFECATTSVAPGSSLMVKVNVFDPEDDNVEIMYTTGTGTIEEQETGVYRWTLPVQLGIYPLEVLVSDGSNEQTSILFVEVAEQPTFSRPN